MLCSIIKKKCHKNKKIFSEEKNDHATLNTGAFS